MSRDSRLKLNLKKKMKEKRIIDRLPNFFLGTVYFSGGGFFTYHFLNLKIPSTPQGFISYILLEKIGIFIIIIAFFLFSFMCFCLAFEKNNSCVK
jgi:hypothetical protein